MPTPRSSSLRSGEAAATVRQRPPTEQELEDANGHIPESSLDEFPERPVAAEPETEPNSAVASDGNRQEQEPPVYESEPQQPDTGPLSNGIRLMSADKLRLKDLFVKLVKRPKTQRAPRAPRPGKPPTDNTATRKGSPSTTPSKDSGKAPPKYEIPEIVPKSGIRGAIWWLAGKRLYPRLGWEWLTALSLRERDRNTDDEIWSQRKVQKIISFLNTKGGSGKTAVCVWVISLWAYIIRRHMVAFDVNEGPGSTHFRLGIERTDTTLLRQFLELVQKGKVNNHSNFTAEVDWPRETGVSVIASDPASSQDILQSEFMDGLRIAKANAHAVACDMGNVVKSSTSLGSVELSQTLIFTGNVRMADSLDDLANTKEAYSNLGYAQKVNNSVIVIVGPSLLWQLLRHGKTLGKLRKEYAERYDHPVARVFVVPFNWYMAHGKVVRINRVPLRIRVILKEILVAIIKAEPAPSDAAGLHNQLAVPEPTLHE